MTALNNMEKPRCSSSTKPPAQASAVDLNEEPSANVQCAMRAAPRPTATAAFELCSSAKGTLQPIAQSYDTLTLHDGHPYRGLSLRERGPLSDVTRYSGWRDNEYVTHMYLHDCSRLF